MRTALTTVTALAMITASVKAELGETPKRFEPRRPDVTKPVNVIFEGRTVKTYYSIWKGRDVTHYGVFYQGRAVEESFWFNDRRPITERDLEIFLKPYNRLPKGAITNGENGQGQSLTWFSFSHADGSRYGVIALNLNARRLMVFQQDAWNYWVGQDHIVATNRPQQPVVSREPRNDGYDDLRPEVRAPGIEERGDEPYPDPTPQLRSAPSEDRKICAIVASEMYARLRKQGTYWVNMLEIDNMAWNGVRQESHCVCVWKVAPSANVFIYEEGIGTTELHTDSTSLDDVIPETEAYYSQLLRMNVTFGGHYAVPQ
jgi:hypothetical protein